MSGFDVIEGDVVLRTSGGLETGVQSNPLAVTITSVPASFPHLVNLRYAESDQAIVAGSYKSVVTYQVPVGYYGWVLQFASLQGESAKSRVVRYSRFGSYDYVTNVYTPDTDFIAPEFSAVVEAIITTATSSSGASPITVTVNYTNESGVAGRVGTFSIPKNSVVGTRFSLTLQAGDAGVRSIQSVTDNSPNPGAFDIVGNVLMAYHNDQSTTIQTRTTYSIGAIPFTAGTILKVEYAGGTVSKERDFNVLLQLVAE